MIGVDPIIAPPYIHRAYEIDQGMVVDKAPGAAEEEDFADDEDDKGTLPPPSYIHTIQYIVHIYTYIHTFVHILVRGLTFLSRGVYDLDYQSLFREVRGRILVQPNLGPGEGQAAGLVAPRGCHPDPDRQHWSLR